MFVLRCRSEHNYETADLPSNDLLKQFPIVQHSRQSSQQRYGDRGQKKWQEVRVTACGTEAQKLEF